jgi:hypothetical protein
MLRSLSAVTLIVLLAACQPAHTGGMPAGGVDPVAVSGPLDTSDQPAHELDPASLVPPVETYLSDRLFADAPSCLVVLSPRGRNEVASTVIERALARHLALKVERVISAGERDAWARSHGLDMAHPGDLQELGRALRCPHGVEARPYGPPSIYGVFWTERRVGLDLSLIRLDGSKKPDPLWRARHIAERSAGGIPTSVFGAISAAARAGRLASDREAGPSILADALRRMMATLPEFRLIARRVRPYKSG